MTPDRDVLTAVQDNRRSMLVTKIMTGELTPISMNTNLFPSPEPPRTDAWLGDRITLLRRLHFADVAEGYPIVSRFGIRARNRFGSIGARDGKTIILVNRLFADTAVPEFVVDGTLAHELAHYAHGFGSGLPRIHADPHRGGVVDRELERRGLAETLLRSEEWRKVHWDAFYQSRCSDLIENRVEREACVTAQWDRLLNHPNGRTEAALRTRAAGLAPRFGFAQPPFATEWLRASLRQTAPSYWYAKSRVVRVHGLLSDPRAPQAMIDFELGYWLAHLAVGHQPGRIQQAMDVAGLRAIAGEAANWRRHAWTGFCSRNHPLLRPQPSQTAGKRGTTKK